MSVQLALALVVGPALAVEPTDYRDDLHRRAAGDVAALVRAGKPQDAVALGERFFRVVEPSAAVAYEVALAHRLAGEEARALGWYDKALSLDPSDAAARYDRAEIYLEQDRVDEARRDLDAALEVRPDSWAIHFRLAEIAAREGDVDLFDAHLTRALRHGFRFGAILADPEWKRWARDPALGLVVERLIVVYDDERLLDELRRTP